MQLYNRIIRVVNVTYILKPSHVEKSCGLDVSCHSSESVWIKYVYQVIPQKCQYQIGFYCVGSSHPMINTVENCILALRSFTAVACGSAT